MFKKRKASKNTSARSKVVVNTEEDKNEVTDVNLKLEAEPDKKGRIEEPKKDIHNPNPDDNNNGTDNVKESYTGGSSKLFKPDILVDEQHQIHKENEEVLNKSKQLQQKDSDGNKIYTGMISKKSQKEVLVKPVSSHVKQNFMMDYQRDVCKDYLKNGYCGFGDTCKFLHYREEFKRNRSAIDKEWETAAKKRRKF